MSYQELNYFNKKLNVQEAMCLLEDKVNELIEVNNAEHQDHLDVMERFKEIDEFITYLQGVGLEKEVRKVMDVFVLDGTFEKLINEKVLNGIHDKVDSFILATDAKIAGKRDKSVLLTQSDLSTSSEAHKLTPNHLNQAVKNMMTGSTPVSPNIADGQITTEKIADSAVNIQKLKIGFNLGFIQKGFLDVVSNSDGSLNLNFYNDGFGVVGDTLSFDSVANHSVVVPTTTQIVYIQFDRTTKQFKADIGTQLVLSKNNLFIATYYQGSKTLNSHITNKTLRLNGVPLCGNKISKSQLDFTLNDYVENPALPNSTTFGGEYLQHLYTLMLNGSACNVRTAGDSITLGYGLNGANGSQYTRERLIKKMLEKTTIGIVAATNGGHGNRTYKDWIGARVGDLGDGQHPVPQNGYLDEDLKLNPDLYVVCYGINDMNVGSISDLRTHLEEGLKRIRGNVAVNGRPSYNKSVEDLSIILCVPFTSTSSGRTNAEWTDKVRPIIKEMCRLYKCAYVDFSMHHYDMTSSDSWSLNGDKLHPTEQTVISTTSVLSNLLIPELFKK